MPEIRKIMLLKEIIENIIKANPAKISITAAILESLPNAELSSFILYTSAPY